MHRPFSCLVDVCETLHMRLSRNSVRGENNMTYDTLDARLACAASFVRGGAVLADVGTDHAYLPIYLCLEGKISGGAVSDINRGPIERARENIRKYVIKDTTISFKSFFEDFQPLFLQ